MRFDNLADWLAWQETLHPARIELRLERVKAIWTRMAPDLGLGDDSFRLPCPVITVGGTNGKGSCVAYLDAWYRAAGYRCCAYTSPHLLRYNERVRIDGAEASDDALCDAFARVDAARGDQLLTYFEFGTLAALDLFVRAGPEIIVLEVGLGGRLDAVNIIEPDVALVTGIAYDHTQWLGETLEQIAFEKAGIFRAGRPAVIGQRDAPPRLRERAEEVGASVLQIGREFDCQIQPGQWRWRGPRERAWSALPAPALRGRFQYDNAASALCAADCLADRLPLPVAAIRAGLHRVQLPGRFTVRPGRPTWVFDVAHNAQAAVALAANLRALPCTGRRHAVFSLLADKDAVAVVAAMTELIDEWHLAPAPGIRAKPVSELQDAVLTAQPGAKPLVYGGLDQALAGAAERASADDCVVVFGSFMTVEAALRNPVVAPV